MVLSTMEASRSTIRLSPSRDPSRDPSRTRRRLIGSASWLVARRVGSRFGKDNSLVLVGTR